MGQLVYLGQDEYELLKEFSTFLYVVSDVVGKHNGTDSLEDIVDKIEDSIDDFRYDELEELVKYLIVRYEEKKFLSK